MTMVNWELLSNAFTTQARISQLKLAFVLCLAIFSLNREFGYYDSFLAGREEDILQNIQCFKSLHASKILESESAIEDIGDKDFCDVAEKFAEGVRGMLETESFDKGFWDRLDVGVAEADDFFHGEDIWKLLAGDERNGAA